MGSNTAASRSGLGKKADRQRGRPGAGPGSQGGRRGGATVLPLLWAGGGARGAEMPLCQRVILGAATYKSPSVAV